MEFSTYPDGLVQWTLVLGSVGLALFEIARGLMPGAFVAAVTEFAPLPVDDKLSVPLAAAGAMTRLAMI